MIWPAGPDVAGARVSWTLGEIHWLIMPDVILFCSSCLFVMFVSWLCHGLGRDWCGKSHRRNIGGRPLDKGVGKQNLEGVASSGESLCSIRSAQVRAYDDRAMVSKHRNSLQKSLYVLSSYALTYVAPTNGVDCALASGRQGRGMGVIHAQEDLRLALELLLRSTRQKWC